MEIKIKQTCFYKVKVNDDDIKKDRVLESINTHLWNYLIMQNCMIFILKLWRTNGNKRETSLCIFSWM